MELLAHPNQGILIQSVQGDTKKLRRLIVDAINKEGSIHAAAKALGVGNATLHYWVKRLKIDVSTKAE